MTPASFLGNKFFVRSVYPILFRAMIEDMKEMFTEKRSFSYYIRITGTPGMGKQPLLGFVFNCSEGHARCLQEYTQMSV